MNVKNKSIKITTRSQQNSPLIINKANRSRLDHNFNIRAVFLKDQIDPDEITKNNEKKILLKQILDLEIEKKRFFSEGRNENSAGLINEIDKKENLIQTFYFSKETNNIIAPDKTFLDRLQFENALLKAENKKNNDILDALLKAFSDQRKEPFILPHIQSNEIFSPTKTNNFMNKNDESSNYFSKKSIYNDNIQKNSQQNFFEKKSQINFLPKKFQTPQIKSNKILYNEFGSPLKISDQIKEKKTFQTPEIKSSQIVQQKGFGSPIKNNVINNSILKINVPHPKNVLKEKEEFFLEKTAFFPLSSGIAKNEEKLNGKEIYANNFEDKKNYGNEFLSKNQSLKKFEGKVFSKFPKDFFG